MDNGAFKRVLSCPLLVVIAAVFGFLYSYVDNINPLPGVVMGFFTLGGDILGTVIAAITAFLSPGIITKFLILFVIIILMGSFIIGFFMSGYMSLLKSAILKGKGDIKAFGNGIKTGFGRSIKGAFLLIIFTEIMAVVLTVSAIPALSTMWSAINGKREMIPLAIFISSISFFAIFFALFFYNAYISFWYPAISLGYNKFITMSKRIIDDSFFGVAAKVFIYTVEILVITLVSILIRHFINNQSTAFFAGMLILEGSLVTLWFLRFTSYTFSAFAELAEKY